jgi:hypothetical protein
VHRNQCHQRGSGRHSGYQEQRPKYAGVPEWPGTERAE